LRQFEVSTNSFLVTGLDNGIQSRELNAGAAAVTQGNHDLEIGVTNFHERVATTFLLPGDVPVLPGTYEWTNVNLFAESSRFRPLSVSAEIICCSFFAGSSLASELAATWQPSRFFGMTASHEWNRLEMPTGDVDIHIASLTGNVTFTPDMQLAIQAQYDNISEAFGLLARYRWEFRPGTELLVAFGQAAVIPSTGFDAQRSQLTVRLGHTFQF
jgi:hypothetical protein